MDETAPQESIEKSPGGSKNMMIVAIVVVIALLGIGGYYIMGRNATKPTSGTTTIMQNTSPTGSTMFSSIADALSKSVSLKCDYVTPDGGKTVAYIKAGAIRTDMMGKTTAENGSVIMKDKKMYFWNGKNGIMVAFNMKSVQADPKTNPSGSPTRAGQNGQNALADLEKFKQYCKPAVVNDKLFAVPADVVFTDMSKGIPSGAIVPKASSVPQSGMTQEQIYEIQNKIMQQQTTPTP